MAPPACGVHTRPTPALRTVLLALWFATFLPGIAGATVHLDCTPGNLAFGKVVVGQQKTLPATLSNTGSSSIKLSSLQLENQQFAVSGLTFPNFDATVDPSIQTNLIFPVPCEFISPSLPRCAVIRPTNPKGIAMAVVNFLTAMNLFAGQSPAFFKALNVLAKQADAAQRGF